MNWTERLAKIWNPGNVKLQTRNGKVQFGPGLRFPLKKKKGLQSSMITDVKRKAAVCLLEKSAITITCDTYKLYHGFGGLKYRLNAEASH